MVRALATLVALCMLTVPAWARPGFTIETDELVVGEAMKLEVQVSGGKPLSAPRVEVPDGVEVEYLGSSPVTFREGGRLVTVYRFVYKISAFEEGEFTIGPAHVELADGTDEQTVTHKLTVSADGEALTKPYQADVSYTPEEVYEGQVVLYRYRLRTRERPARTRWIEPEHQGLVAPRDGDRPRREYAIEDADGPIWIDETIIPYIVTGTGDLSLQSAILQLWWSVERRDPMALFGPTRNETLQLGPAPLLSKALPPAPPEYSGLVGDFELRSAFDKTELAVGESATWTIRLGGNGALDGFALPKPEGEGFRIYEGGLATDAAVKDGQYVAQSRAELSVVATKAGTIEIPPLELVVFSPEADDYVTLSARGTALQVAPGAGGITEVESFAPDAEPPAEAAAPPDIREPWPRGLASTVWLGPLLLPILALAAFPGLLALLVQLGRRLAAFVRARRQPVKVVVDPAARLRHLPEDRHQRLSEVDSALREALALRFELSLAELDREEALQALPPELRDEARALTAALDRARFADGPSKGLVDRAVALVTALSQAEAA